MRSAASSEISSVDHESRDENEIASTRISGSIAEDEEDANVCRLLIAANPLLARRRVVCIASAIWAGF